MKQISRNVSYNASINLLVKTFAIKISPFRASLFPYFVEVRVRAHKYIGDATRRDVRTFARMRVSLYRFAEVRATVQGTNRISRRLMDIVCVREIRRTLWKIRERDKSSAICYVRTEWQLN